MSVILDSSALLAGILAEPGHDLVTQAVASDAAMSSVNLAEAMTILVRNGLPASEAERALAKAPVTIRSMIHSRFALERCLPSRGHSDCRWVTALVWRWHNVRICPVLTTDRAWAQAASLVGVTIKLIR
jgi:PIN domain nuclease of toxin-antitoxin system